MTDDLFSLMEDLKTGGRIRSWGVSIDSIEEGIRAIEGGAQALQLVYNILQQKVGDAIFPLAQEKGVGVIVRVPLASGWLTGKYSAETAFPPDDHRSQTYPMSRCVKMAAKVGRLGFLLEEASTLTEGALRFALANPAVSTVIPGAKRPDQVVEHVKASGNPLPEETIRRLRTTFG